MAGVEWESESESSSLQCEDSEESEYSEVTGDDGGETPTFLIRRGIDDVTFVGRR